MFSVIRVTSGGKPDQSFCFRTRKDLDRFRAFCRVYAAESGGNSYGSYHISEDAGVAQFRTPPAASTTDFDDQLIRDMMSKILMNRTASRPPPVAVGFDIGVRNGGITFTCEPLPLRQRPTVGDLCRPFERGAVVGEGFVSDSRVVADHGDALEVVSAFDEEAGRIKAGAPRVTVYASKVMKIFDWMKASRAA